MMLEQHQPITIDFFMTYLWHIYRLYARSTISNRNLCFLVIKMASLESVFSYWILNAGWIFTIHNWKRNAPLGFGARSLLSVLHLCMHMCSLHHVDKEAVQSDRRASSKWTRQWDSIGTWSRISRLGRPFPPSLHRSARWSTICHI